VYIIKTILECVVFIGIVTIGVQLWDGSRHIMFTRMLPSVDGYGGKR